MSRERFDALERFVPLIDAPEPSYEGLLRRRDRKHRNQRIAALVVGITVAVAPALILASGGSFDDGLQPATQTTSTAPTVVHQDAVGVGIVGLAPAGATPSLPQRGEPVLSFMFGHTPGGDPGRFNGTVYEDGRIVWQRLDPSTPGIIEQRLSPEGVDLVVAEAMSTGLFHGDLYLTNHHGLIFGGIEVRSGDTSVSVGWGDSLDMGDLPTVVPTPEQAAAILRLEARLADPTSWLPPSAWEDPTIRAFVPSGYGACFRSEGQDVGRSDVFAALPTRAEDLVRTWGMQRHEYTNLLGTFAYWCADLRTDEAHELARALEDAISVREASDFGLFYELEGSSTADITLEVVPNWPGSFES